MARGESKGIPVGLQVSRRVRKPLLNLGKLGRLVGFSPITFSYTEQEKPHPHFDAVHARKSTRAT